MLILVEGDDVRSGTKLTPVTGGYGWHTGVSGLKNIMPEPEPEQNDTLYYFVN